MATVRVETRFSPSRRGGARHLVPLSDWNETIHSSGNLYGAVRVEIDGVAIMSDDVFGAIDLLWLSILSMIGAIIANEAYDDNLYDCTRLRLVAKRAGGGRPFHRDQTVHVSLVAPDDLPEYNRSASAPAALLVNEILTAAAEYYQWMATNKHKDRPDAMQSLERVNELRTAFDSARGNPADHRKRG